MFARPNNTPELLKLAARQMEVGRFWDAQKVYQQILHQSPHHEEALTSMAKIFMKAGKCSAAVQALECLDDEVFHASAYLMNLKANALRILDRTDEARALYNRVLERDPDNANAHHQIATMEGNTHGACSENFVTSMFDGEAEAFDEHLVKNLSYQTPQSLAHVLKEQVPAEKLPFESVIDLGCGTGLSGDALRGMFKHIEGVDLSSKMIDVARRKKIYNHLYVGSITNFTAQNTKTYNLCVAADVFVYIADLAPIFEGVKSILAPSGYFIFSIEKGENEAGHVNAAGRIEHHPQYINELAQTYGFTCQHAQDITIRTERKQPVNGMCFLLKAPQE